MKKSIKPYILSLIIIGVVLLFIVSIIKKNNYYVSDSNYKYSNIRDRTFEEQIKFDVDNKEILENISNSRKILKYQLKSLGKYDYQDYYYDSPNYDIAKLGCSYRFRIADKGNNNIEYRYQFKKEYDVNSKENFVRREIDVPIPKELAEKILAGDFNRLFFDNLNNEKIRELNAFLKSQNINLKKISPIIYGQQYRDRYSLKENNIKFFEISLDEARFVHLKDKDKKLKFCELEFENKYTGGYRTTQPDFIEKRIKQFINYLSKKYKIVLIKDSKYKRVINAFSLI